MDNDGLFFLFAIAILAVFLVAAYRIMEQDKKRKKEKEEQRRLELMEKYEDEEIVTNIMAKNVWIGETAEMLTDSLGPPVAMDVKQLKTKKKEVWKYAHRGGNRYNIRVTLDNDEVVQWDIKNS